MQQATAKEYQTQHNIKQPKGDHNNTANAADTGALPQHHHTADYYYHRGTSDRTKNYEHNGYGTTTADTMSTTNSDKKNTAAADTRAMETSIMSNTITEGTTTAMQIITTAMMTNTATKTADSTILNTGGKM